MPVSQVTEVVRIRSKVLAEIARMAYEDCLERDIGSMMDTIVSEAGPRYRCCVHKEKAVLRQRINLTLSQPLHLTQEEAAAGALAGEIEDMPFIHVLPEACDQCPIDKFLVTDACRNCLAHNCINSCPKKAIMVVQNRAYIDKTRCVECGLCKKSCQYGAIIEISRPCERVCSVQAIIAGSDRKAVIDQDKCVECGACREACPFGAIGDRSLLVQVIQQIKTGKQVYAILAPAFAGHFGAKTKPGQMINAIRQLGFHEVKEVAYGADIVTIKEANEFLETVPEQRPFMTSSCCPAFVALVEKHFADMKDMVSSTVSPMLAIAQIIKNSNPEAVIVFIGPCIAKKSEARNHSDLVDFALTFEEIDAMLTGKGIELSTVAESEFQSAASTTGNAFACAGGVAKAVQAAVAGLDPEATVKAHSAEGLENCANALKLIRSGKMEVNFLEGMSCTGGCIGGPAGLANARVASKLVATFAKNSTVKSALNNRPAQSDSEQPGHWHR
ncbi:4Fe-4S dicluster domain-containing protein [Sporomusa sp.]|uniref:4Fe-4S dicluster domain-containing protein n=1 Tax=Sporomusa sp. TaxID=2078658 RepID=UPI002BAE8A01|nr:4Fe-4S dicluster domain-containing protein [Sporomusa sp.]HWR42722.1 4Fe-4S dicluster domain-containing protein [Sporomusa sp.]